MDKTITNNFIDNFLPHELITKTEEVDIKAKIGQVLPLLNKIPAVIVNKNGHYYGIFDSRSMARARVQLRFAKDATIEKYVTPVPPITSSTDIDSLLNSFYTFRTKALPYIEKNKLVGVLDRNTLLKILLSRKMLGNASVESIMSTPVIAVNIDIGMSQAKKIMEDNKINRLLVVKNGKVVGLLTYFTLVGQYSMINERRPEMTTKNYIPPTKSKISEIIETNPKTIRADENIAVATRRFVEENISSLIVVDKKDVPIGIATVSDVLERVMAERKFEENRIFIAGLDETTKSYEPELREELKELLAKFEKSKSQKIDYAQLHIKRIKNKLYDISIRVAVQGGSVVISRVTNYLLENAFNEAIAKLKRDLIKEKGRLITIKKSYGRHVE
ncbi:MAG: CBS domain-containing protein [Candidatus Micrarchaeaceae archaeon]